MDCCNGCKVWKLLDFASILNTVKLTVDFHAFFRNTCNSRYWVLPCCFFDLYGKYERKHPKRNQYEDYLEYIKVIGQICGFDMSTDVMRIPSTKRVSQVFDKMSCLILLKFVLIAAQITFVLFGTSSLAVFHQGLPCWLKTHDFSI